MKTVYLDNNATTKVEDRVIEVMSDYFSNIYGNPSSIHDMGFEAREKLEEAREKIAQLLNCKSEEIFFTGSGTESDNIAIKGAAYKYQKNGNHIITSKIEHHAVLNSFKALEKEGFNVSYVNVDKNGIIDIDHFKSLIKDNTIFVSIMHANNETGAIQPIEKISDICKGNNIIFHTDAVQTTGKLIIDLEKMKNIDLLTFSGHKIHAPKGIGVLFKRKGVHLKPIMHGGHHERKIRPGTENVPYIIGIAKAFEIAQNEHDKNEKHIRELRDYFYNQIIGNFDKIIINTPIENSVYNTLNVSFKGLEGESILLTLSEKGIMASSGSACTSDSLDPSHVLLAMGRDHLTAHGSIRFSLSKYISKEDIDYTIDILKETITKIRNISPYK